MSVFVRARSDRLCMHYDKQAPGVIERHSGIPASVPHYEPGRLLSLNPSIP